MTVRELQEKRLRLHERQKELLAEVAKQEERKFTAEQDTEFDKISGDLDALEREIERVKSVEEREAAVNEYRSKTRGSFDEGSEHRDRSEKEDRGAKKDAQERAFDAYVRYGMVGLSPEDRAALNWNPGAEGRAQATTPDSAGGYFVPEGFSNELDRAMLAFGGLMGVCRVINTATGNPLPWPTSNDTGNTGALLAENTQDGEQDITMGAVTFNAYKYTSKIVRASVEIQQDSAFDLNGFVAGALGERLGRAVATHLATGDGSSKPRGILVAAPIGETTASSGAVSYDDLLDWQHSVDPSYRAGARFVFSDSTLKQLRKLVDGNSRPIWLPADTGSAQNGAPSTLLGQPYTVDNSFPAFAADTVVAAYGDLSKYIVRRVRDLTLRTLVERYADYHQIAWVAFNRFDADLVDAGTNPIKTLKIAA